MYEIDKGIKIPDLKKTGPECAYPWDKMEIGDSFFIREGEINNPYGIISAPNKQYRFKKKFTCRKIEDGHRIWRIR